MHGGILGTLRWLLGTRRGLGRGRGKEIQAIVNNPQIVRIHSSVVPKSERRWIRSPSLVIHKPSVSQVSQASRELALDRALWLATSLRHWQLKWDPTSDIEVLTITRFASHSRVKNDDEDNDNTPRVSPLGRETRGSAQEVRPGQHGRFLGRILQTSWACCSG